MTSTKLSANDAARNRIRTAIDELETRIEAACVQAGRARTDVSLLGVSKGQDAEKLALAYDCGLRRFGENYLQEALEKIAALPADCEWHFIGPLQSNKTRAVAENFAWVHSVDRGKIARRLSEQRPSSLPPLNICLQVNVGDEESKSGVRPDALGSLVTEVQALPRLQIHGLMCIPRPTADPDEIRAQFRLLRELRDQHLPDAKVLSMGMSSDIEEAILEGSTIIRVGSALFGPRARPQDSA